jgi:hypothetical protein
MNSTHGLTIPFSMTFPPLTVDPPTRHPHPPAQRLRARRLSSTPEVVRQPHASHPSEEDPRSGRPNDLLHLVRLFVQNETRRRRSLPGRLPPVSPPYLVKCYNCTRALGKPPDDFRLQEGTCTACKSHGIVVSVATDDCTIVPAERVKE